MIGQELRRPEKFRRPKVVPLPFYRRDTVTVARELLGKQLIHTIDGERVGGLIVETEAYTGIEDPACHTFNDRRTLRTESMYLEGGHAYVYFIYGMYHCLNVVTRGAGCPEAVLIRALQPTEGIQTMMKLRSRKSKVRKIEDLSNGPGKLCQALDLDRRHDGLLLSGPMLKIEDVGFVPARNGIVATDRVGVDYAGHASRWPFRFYLKNNPFISRL